MKRFFKGLTLVVSSILLSTLMFATVVSANTQDAYEQQDAGEYIESQRNFGSRTFTSNGIMAIINLPRGQTANSSVIPFNVTNLPAGATVTSISVTIGSSTSAPTPAGLIVPNHLRVTSSVRPGQTLQIPWSGQLTTLHNTHFFWGHSANALWQISWNGTNSSLLPTPGTRSFGRVSITINYEW